MANPLAPISFRSVALENGQFLRWSYPGVRALADILLTATPIKDVKEFRLYEKKGGAYSLLKTLPGNQFELPIPPEWSGLSLVIDAVIAADSKQFPGAETDKSLPVIVTGKECLPDENKVPPWFSAIQDQEEKNTLSGSHYYQEWLSYTANLCSDVRRVYSENKAAKVTWRAKDDTKLLYHGDEEGRTPAEIFVTGLTAPEPLGSMQVRIGTHKGALESFSYSLRVAAEYAGYEPDDFIGLGKYVYVIAVDGGLDVDLTVPGQRREAEIAYPGGVHPRHIVGAFEIDAGQNIAAYHPNPRFRQSDNLTPEGFVDVMTVCSAELTIKTYLNPANHHIIHPEMVRVRAGTPVTVSLADSNGVPYVSPWRVNNELFDFDTLNQTGASACLINTTHTRPDRTIVVEAVQDYDFLDEHNDIVDPKRIKSEGIVLVPRKGPAEFSVQVSTTDDEHYDYHFTWTPLTAVSGVTGYRIYLIRKSRRHYERILLLFAGGADAREASFHTQDYPPYDNEFIVTACVGDNKETGDSQLSTPPEPKSES